MIKTFRFLIDTTKAKMAAYPGSHVIIDSHAGGAIVALCPITEGNEPICEGQFSFAPLVQRALEHEKAKVVLDGRISLLVEAAFREGHRAGRTTRNTADEGWAWSGSRTELKRVLADTEPSAVGASDTINFREPGVSFPVWECKYLAPDTQVVKWSDVQKLAGS